MTVPISLIMVTRDALKPWKCARRVLTEAKHRGIEVVLAVDDRSRDRTRETLAPLADTLIDYANKDAYGENAVPLLLARATHPWVFWIADDEEPSQKMWDALPGLTAQWAQHSFRFNWVLPGWRQHMAARGTDRRLLPKEVTHYPGGFDQMIRCSAPEVVHTDLVLWHYALLAPRKVREQKMAGYVAAGGPASHARIYLWENSRGLDDIPISPPDEDQRPTWWNG